MWYLTLELWPYALAALGIGAVTGWFAGCAPRQRSPAAEPEAAR